jgi:uncharacterized phage protein (TIGR01671 family)
MKPENIKFKAKRLDGKGWVCGYFYEENGNTYIIENRQKESKLNRNLSYQVDPSTVCQFTGLKDCEDKEVWEGDVLLNTNSGSQYTVMYSDYGGAFFIRKKGTANDDMYLFELSDVDKCIAFLEVIGNKFDK